MTARHGINQGIQGRPQSRVDFGQLLAPAAQTADPRRRQAHRGVPGDVPVRVFPRDRVPCQARGDSDGRDAAPTQCPGFGGGPLSSHALVHHRGQGEEFLSNPFRRVRVSHATTMRMTPILATGICTGYFFAVPKFGFRTSGIRTMNTSPALDGAFSRLLDAPVGGDRLPRDVDQAARLTNSISCASGVS